MKTISIMNVKGGVGKTTTAVNLATILASERETRTLLIDADAQGDATSILSNLGEGELEGFGLYGLLNTCGCYDEYVEPTRYRNLDLMPASDDQFSLGIDQADKVRRAMGDLIACIDEDQSYDLVLIDCPPHFNACSVAAICCSDVVIIPVKLDAFSVSGYRYLLRQIEEMQAYLSREVEVIILPTMYTVGDACCQQAIQLLTDNLPLYVSIAGTQIRSTPKVNESTFYGLPVCEYSKFSSAGRDYRDFAADLALRLRRD